MGDGTGIGTFNDRIRDAVRGGAHDDRGIAHVRSQGFVNGLYTDPNAENSGSDEEKSRLLHAADLVRLGLAGSLAEFSLRDHRGQVLAGRDIDYHGQAAGYTSDPQEAINYVAAHDNETLFDINQYKLPREAPMAERVRAQNLATSLVLLAQGVPFLHAGQELLRSKSLDRNSYDSGDWFNLLDFSFEENGWGRGLPPRWDNADNWDVAAALLADPALKPDPAAIRSARAHVLEMLAIRRSSPLFRLRNGEAVNQALRFHNTGPGQVPGLIVMSLEREYEAMVVVINAGPDPLAFELPGDPFPQGAFALHPVLQNSYDPRNREAVISNNSLKVPARTTAVFVRH
jgi:pullulanase-type alpha-1,6-glucosidase